MHILFAFAVVSLVVWCWLLLAHGRFWLSGPTLDAPSPLRPLRITVIVPARNEAEHVVPTLRSLLAQQVSGELRVILIDDNSTDATGDLARQIASSDPRLKIVTGEPLPAGWSGKLWAVSQGLRQPEALNADYVLLTDADIIHAPGHLAALTSHAELGGFGLVSEMVRLRCETFAERATIPAFVFFFQMLYPFRWVSDRRKKTAAAAGGTMLLARRALDAVEGVTRIRAALIDDVALAREVKQAGFPVWLGHAQEAISERTYPRFSDVWNMIARTAYVQLKYSPLLLLSGTCLGMLLIYALPVAATASGPGITRWLGAVAWLLMAAAFQPTLRRYRCNPLWGLALPAIALFYLAATCGSAIRFYQGRGGHWKDRSYPARADSNTGQQRQS